MPQQCKEDVGDDITCIEDLYKISYFEQKYREKSDQCGLVENLISVLKIRGTGSELMNLI